MELADNYGGKLGMGRREFLKTASGMAAAFLAIISVKGIEYPPVWHEMTFKKAPKAKGNKAINEKTLDFD